MTPTLLRAARTSLSILVAGAALIAAAPADAAVPFSAPFHFSAGLTPGAIAVGDLNGDGRPDIVVTDGGCPSPPPYTTPPPCSSDGPVLRLRLGGPLGTFGPSVPYSAGGYPSSPVIGDFFGNGRNDVAVEVDGRVKILPGSRLGVLGTPVSLPAPLDALHGSLAVGDLNGDGALDIAAPDFSGNIELWLSNGHGEFAAPVSYPFGAFSTDGGPGIASLAIADFNHDGHADIAVSWSKFVTTSNVGGYSTPQVSVLFGDGRGGISSRSDLTPPVTEAASTGSLAIGDVNGDGNPDIVVTTTHNTSTQFYLPEGRIVSYLGDGRGGFAAPVLSSVAGSEDLTSTHLADFDGDGRLDVAVLGDYPSVTYALRGDGAGHFVDAQAGYAGATTHDIAVADFLGDDRPDIATVNGGSQYTTTGVSTDPNTGIAVFYNLSRPSWWPAGYSWAWPSVLAQWASGAWPSQLTPWDINSWVPLPPVGAWGSLFSPVAGIASAPGAQAATTSHHRTRLRPVVGPLVLRHAGRHRLPRWLTPHTVSRWAAAAHRQQQPHAHTHRENQH